MNKKRITMMHKILKYLKKPSLLYLWAASKGLTDFVPDELHIRISYRIRTGEALNLDNPSTFNEKMQWLKLHDHNPLYPVLADKFRVKSWIIEHFGPEYVAETLGVWKTAEEIDIDSLPDAFVLKTNHDTGGIAICHNKRLFDIDSAKAKLHSHLSRNYYYRAREWPYKDVSPLVFAEEYLASDSSAADLVDYKLFTFSNGRIITLVCEDRHLGSGMKKTFFDEDWKALPLTEGGHPVNESHPRPYCFAEMKRLASIISHEMPFARIDFYELNHRLIFGEVTFYPNAGFEEFYPIDWNQHFGSWIDLNKSQESRMKRKEK